MRSQNPAGRLLGRSQVNDEEQLGVVEKRRRNEKGPEATSVGKMPSFLLAFLWRPFGVKCM